MIDSQYLAFEEQLPYTVLQMVRGDTAEFDFAVKNPQTGQAVDCSGADAKMGAKAAYEDTSLVIDISTTSGDITWTNAAEGLGHIVIPSAQTLALPNERQDLQFDIQVASAGGRSWTVARGRIEVLAQVST